MSLRKMLGMILPVVGVLALAGGLFGTRVYQLSKATHGEAIASGLPHKRALLVLDVQEDTLGVAEYGDTAPLMANINAAIRYAAAAGMDIVYTRQEFSSPIDKLMSGALYEKGSSGSALSGQREASSPLVYSKEKTDAFSNVDLDAYLREAEITTLCIVGADASACVYKTALGGRNRGYEVIVLTDCLFSVNEAFLGKALENYEENGIELSDLDTFMK
jgi:nicotinamidase-related amidase